MLKYFVDVYSLTIIFKFSIDDCCNEVRWRSVVKTIPPKRSRCDFPTSAKRDSKHYKFQVWEKELQRSCILIIRRVTWRLYKIKFKYLTIIEFALRRLFFAMRWKSGAKWIPFDYSAGTYQDHLRRAALRLGLQHWSIEQCWLHDANRPQRCVAVTQAKFFSWPASHSWLGPLPI